jgi:hypothetical protein
MDLFPASLKVYNESIHNSTLYLVDLDSALVSCGSELFDIFDKCFGSCQRCAKFFQRFGSDYIFHSEDKLFANKDKIKGNGLLMSFLNAFGLKGGFDKILNFINFETQDSK